MSGGGEKIELFKFIQKTYQTIGLPTNPLESDQNHRPVNSKNVFFLFSLTQLFISTAAYLLFQANSAIEYGMVFFTCASIVFCFNLYLIFFRQMEIISNYIENCERFIEERPHSMLVYKNANGKIERLTEYFAYALIVSAFFFVVPALLYTTVNYYLLHAEKESFFLFFPTWWPFDWKTPIGYSVAWLLQCAGTAAVTITGLTFFNMVFGSIWIFIVIAKDIINDVAAFNDTVAIQKQRNDRSAESIERFRDIIQPYLNAKQCVNDFNEICEYSLFAFFAWNMLSTSSLLVTLQFQLWDDDARLFEILILSMITLWIFVLNLVFCEPGELVTNQFDQFSLEFERCEWYKLPIEMQRKYLIFLSDTQQPKNIQCFGGFRCTRNTFKQMTNKGFSYFMALRNFRA